MDALRLRRWCSQFHDPLRGCNWVNSEIHLEAEIKQVSKYSWRLMYCELTDILGGSDQAKVEVYLMVVNVVVVNQEGWRTSAETLFIGLQVIIGMLIQEYIQVWWEMWDKRWETAWEWETIKLGLMLWSVSACAQCMLVLSDCHWLVYAVPWCTLLLGVWGYSIYSITQCLMLLGVCCYLVYTVSWCMLLIGVCCYLVLAHNYRMVRYRGMTQCHDLRQWESGQQEREQ